MASPLKQFEIETIIPFDYAGLNLDFTNSSLWMAIAAFLGVAFFVFATDTKNIVPSRSQAAAEKFYILVKNMVYENAGPKAMEYVPFVFSVFLFVLMGNLVGLIPKSFTFTSHIIATGTLALFIFTVITAIGIVRHGFKFLNLFNPPSVPLLLKPLVIPIEIVSYFIRPLTLSVRLFANMMAGHLVLKVFAGMSVLAGVALGFVPAIFNIAFYALETLVSVLQAYVFALLTAIYFKDAVEIDH